MPNHACPVILGCYWALVVTFTEAMYAGRIYALAMTAPLALGTEG